MKNFKIFSILLIMVFSTYYVHAQKGGGELIVKADEFKTKVSKGDKNNDKDGEPNVQADEWSVFTTTLDLCDDTKHVLIKLDVNPHSKDGGEVSSLEVIPFRNPQDLLSVSLSEGKQSLDLHFWNQTPINGELKYKVLGKSSDGKTLVEEEIVVVSSRQSKTDNDEDVINVSDELADILEGHKDSKTFLTTYFCGKKVSQLEILSFFDDFYDFSDEEICEMIAKYNSIMGSFTDVVDFSDPSTMDKLCTVFTEWLEIARYGGSGPRSVCNCKLIQTTSSAISIGTGNEDWPASGEDCINYEGETYAKNRDNTEGDSDIVFSYGRLGAAMAGTLEILTDGNDDLDEPFQTNMPRGYSAIAYQSVCDPITQAVTWDDCNCRKQITVTYGYYSDLEVEAKTWTNIFQEESAEIKVSDWYAVMIENGDDEIELMGGDMGTLQTKCEAEEDSAVDHILENADSIAIKIAKALGKSTTIGAIVTAAEAIIELAEVTIFKDGCGTVKHIESINDHGTENVYFLNPGDKFKATMVSGAKFVGQTMYSARASAAVNSAFYLTGVLQNAPVNDTIPDYCSCEAIATYTVGTLEGMTPYDVAEEVEWDENDSEIKWDEIFDAGPLNLFDMQYIVGTFIGHFGDWGDAFEKSGCCVVVIPCHSDCVAVTGCDDIHPMTGTDNNLPITIDLDKTIEAVNKQDTAKRIEHILKNEDFTRELQMDRLDFKVYPNPSEYGNEVVLEVPYDISIRQIRIYDINAKQIYSSNNVLDINMYILEELSDKTGIFVIQLTDDTGRVAVKKIIKL